MNRTIFRMWTATIAAVILLTGSTIVRAASEPVPETPPPPTAPDSILGQLAGSSAQTGIQGTVSQFQMLSGQLRNIGGGGNGGVAVIGLPGPASGMAMPQTGYGGMQLARSYNSDPAVIRAQSLEVMHGAWFNGYDIGGNVEGTAVADGLDYAASGGQFGLYRLIDTGTAIGGFAGYSTQSVDLIAASSTSDINSGQLGMFFRRVDAFGYFLLAGAVAYDSYDTARSTATGTAVGDYAGLQSSAFLERGWSFYHRGIVLEPSLALQYTWLRQNNYVETGAGANNLTFSEATADSLRSIVGIRLSRPICTRIGLFTPELRGHWMHECLDGTTSVIITAAGPPGTSTGVDLGREWAMVGGGITLDIGSAVSLFANYDA